MKFYRKIVGIIIAFAAFNFAAHSQHIQKETTIEGIVVDSITGEPMPFAAIFLKGSDRGTMTDDDGKFNITTGVNFISLNVSLMGYENKEVFVKKGHNNNVVIKIVPTGVALKEVVVKPRKEKYSKKNNPAVEFVKKVIKKRDIYDPQNHEYYNYDKYHKLTCGLSGFNPEKKNWVKKRFNFIYEFMDTSEISGKRILPLSIKEMVSTEHYRLHPKNAQRIY